MGDNKPRKVCNVQAGIRLKEYLKRMNATHADLAAIFDVSESNMDKTLNGKQGLNVDKLTKVYESMHIEPNEIVLGFEYASRFKCFGMNSKEYDIFVKSGKSKEEVLVELAGLPDEEFEDVFDFMMRSLLDERERRKRR